MSQQDNPQMRRLRADYERVQQLVNQSDLIRIINTQGNPPNVYTIEYTCRGVERVQGNQAVMRDTHQVVFTLPSGYPRDKPHVRFETPIFHPNISSGGGVCIGPWYASKWLDELVIMIAELIQYKIPPTRDTLTDVLTQSAVEWLRNNRNRLPVDKREIKSDVIGNIKILGKGSGDDDFEIRILG